VVERHAASLARPLLHAWQPDEGYRRARCLNLGALTANGRYLLFLDGDCIPRRGFLAALRRCLLPGWFVASKRLHLGTELSRRVLAEHVPVWGWSVPRLLAGTVGGGARESRRPGVLLPLRDRRRPWRPGQPEFRPPYDGYGFFFGVFREDFERVNGFDMRFRGWGGEDVELAARLRRLRLRCGWPGPRATVLHLWHPVRKSVANIDLLRESEGERRLEAVSGLRELAAQVSANRVDASSSSSEPAKR
jgi:hypothetical protein